MGTWKCPKCGHIKTVYCPNCGSEKEAGTVCPRCGQTISYTECPKCGYSQPW